jgi:cation/acetate symporter
MAGLRPPEADIGVVRVPLGGLFALLCLFGLLLLVLALFDRIGLASGMLAETVIVGCLALFVLAALLAPGHRPVDHYVAGRAVAPVYGGLAAASSLTGLLVVGFVGGVFASGAEIVGAGCGLLIGVLLLALFIAPRLRRFGGYSVGDFLAARFGLSARLAGALVAFASSFLLFLAVLKLAATLLADLAGLTPVQGLYAAAGMTALVVLPGGLRSLTWTQVLQYWLAALACLLCFGFLALHGDALPTGAAAAAAGVQALAAAFVEPSNLGAAPGAALPVLLLAVGAAALPPMLLPALRAPSERGAQLSMAWVFVFSAAAIAAGLVLGSALAAMSGTQVAPLGAGDLIGLALPILTELPAILVGLIAAAGLAALFALGQAALFSAAAVLSHDLWDEVLDRKGPTGRRMLVARALVLAMSAAAAWVIGRVPFNAAELVGWALCFAGSGSFTPLVLGLWWRRCNAVGALAGTLIGFAVAGLGFSLDLGLLPGLPVGPAAGVGSVGAAALGLSGSLLATIAASLMTRTPGPAAQKLMDAFDSPRRMPPIRERPA